MPRITCLEASMPLTKRFCALEDGSIDVTPYPMAWQFTSHEVDAPDLVAFHDVLIRHGEEGQCLYKGAFKRPLVNESRAGLTHLYAPTSFVCLDFDRMTVFESVEEALEAFGLGETSYILQESASSGMKPGLNAHVFFLLDAPVNPTLLKHWLKHLNLEVVFRRQPPQLLASKVALRWPLDITVCQNDKILYIAPPIFEGMDDPLAGQRIQLVEKDRARLSIEKFDVIPSQSAIRQREVDTVTELRRLEGLGRRKLEEVYVERLHTYVMRNPEAAQVSGIKKARGFVYLNIDGGDSWGYFHPESNADVIYNFKGEPSYPTAKLLPDYYHEAQQAAAQARQAEVTEAHTPTTETDDPQYFVFNDRKTASYYKARFDPAQDQVELWPAKTLKHLADFCLLHDLPVPEAVPDWDVLFDPRSTRAVDPDKRVINLYQPTRYKLSAHQVPPSGSLHPYEVVIRHALGDDTVAYDRFMNWLAYIWQTSLKARTAWVLHGVPGTGKGLLMRVLRELFGRHCLMMGAESLSKPYNAALQTAQILILDEVDVDQFTSASVESKLRSWIVESPIEIRDMYKPPIEVDNYTNILIFANQGNAAPMQSGDRRYNVAPRQEMPLSQVASDSLIDSLFYEDNLRAFAYYLQHYAVDASLAHVPLVNEAKLAMQSATLSVPEEIIENLKKGNFDYFMWFLPEPGGAYNPHALPYRQLMDYLLSRIAQSPSLPAHIGVTKQELRTIFALLAAWDQTSAKFNKALARYGMPITDKRIRRGAEVMQGIYFDWHIDTSLIPVYRKMLEAESNVVYFNPDQREQREQAR